jgi:signal transduction histidine kinase
MTVKESLITRIRRALTSVDEPGRLIMPASGENSAWFGHVMAVAAIVPMTIVMLVSLVATTTPAEAIATIAFTAGFLGAFLMFTYRSAEARLQRWLAIELIFALALNVYPGPERGMNFAPFAIVAAQAAIALPLGRAVFWLLGCATGSIVTSWLAYASRAGLGQATLIGLANATGYAFFAVVGGLMRQAIRDRRLSEALNRELEGANARLEAMSARERTLAVVEERNRMAREMHDSLGHRLTVAIVQLEGAQRLIPTDPERAGRMVGAMRDQMKEALGELRSSVAALRAPVEDDLPLGPALKQLGARFAEGTGLAVDVSIPEDLPELSPAQRLALYRAAQEGLTNAHKHAGARRVRLNLARTPSTVSIEAIDDGAGIDAADAAGSFGLMGLRERAAQLGGTVQLASMPDEGARLVFEIPLEAKP